MSKVFMALVHLLLDNILELPDGVKLGKTTLGWQATKNVQTHSHPSFSSILSYHTTLYQWDQKCNPNDITNFCKTIFYFSDWGGLIFFNLVPALSKNVFYTPNGNIEFTCGKSNFTSLASWTATPDHPDRGSQVFARSSLSTADIIAMGKALLK